MSIAATEHEPPSTATRVVPVRTAAVVGGGIAGLAAALHLADAGYRPIVFETRKKLGGRATSFADVRTGETLDNCQHVALGCCVNYLALLRRLGVESLLEWTDELHFVEAGGRVSTIRPGPTPAPGHFTLSFLRASFLTFGEKAAVARAMAAILRTERDHAGTFLDWLRARGQPERAIARFWSPVIVSACNVDVDRAAASSALKVFRDGFLARRDASRMAVAGVPLVRLYDPAFEAVRAAGGEVRLGASVESLDARSVVLASGETVRADVVICAAPPERACRLVGEQIRRADDRFERMERIPHSPILGAHLEFDRPITDLPHATLVERPVQWLFSKGRTESGGQRLHAVVSAADAWVPLEEEEIGRRVLEDVRACFPRAGGASLVRIRAVKEKRATFAPTPEAEALRPGAAGPSGVILAGDATRTGWPATMEGAARSGAIAAAVALGRDEHALLEPEPQPAALVRALSV